MAAPHVTGAVALLLARGVLGPHPTTAAIAAAPDGHRARSRAAGRDRDYAAGLVDAAAALRGTQRRAAAR